MPESIDAWWARRQRSKEREVPYAVGTFRDDWAQFPVLVRQYHPDLNREITLTQVPPAADVYLTWQCDTGHVFVATPAEQRSRPGGVRRRSVWCPVCSELAAPTRVRPAPMAPHVPPEAGRGPGPQEDAPHGTSRRPGTPAPARAGAGAVRRARTTTAPRRSTAGIVRLAEVPFAVPVVVRPERTAGAPQELQHPAPPSVAPRPSPSPNPTDGAVTTAAAPASEDVRTDPRRRPGEAFHSARAPRTASAAEADLRQRLAARFDLDLSPERANAVAVNRPFFGRIEVWPDIVITELRVAIEYDTVGRFGLEHVGPREQTDRRKDRMLRAVGWEVVRVRCGRLQPIGPFDLVASGVTDKAVDALIERLRAARGDLFVNAYLR
ncbi:zinc-ribbon domain-containing protein [Herbiconiux sp. P18]|uniref:zinc-ribbon domain-containing protein n=1 Tax=Herbiconiux liangxiaofengii TaxID=3342795 RepID=UPI0035B8D51A